MKRKSSPVARHQQEWDMETDVIVIGYGGAGAVTAITAHDAGARVIVLEKSPSIASLKCKTGTGNAVKISGGGGNTHIAMGTAVSPASPDDATNYLHAACGGLTPLDVCKAWAEEVCKNEAWFKIMGIKGSIVTDWHKINPYIPNDMPFHTEYPALPGAQAMTIYRMIGWGPAFFARLDWHIQKRGIKVLFSTPGKELIQDPGNGEITGVIAENKGIHLRIKAKKGVVLCTGGFEFNEEMKNNFLKCWPMKFYGWKYNTGDGIKMAQKAGADIWHMDVVAGGNCAWFDDPDYNFGISIRTKTDNYIWVNKFGSRFCSEPDAWQPHGGWVIHLYRNLEYPGFSRIPSYIVFDHTSMKAGPLGEGEALRKGGLPMGRRLLPRELGGYEGWSDDNKKELDRGWIKKGNSIEELARAIGGEMDPTKLKISIEKYNACCAGGKDEEFRRPLPTLHPVKTPPFYAVPLYPGQVSTCGGPVRSARGEVLDPFKKPIPRLYSAGSCGSVYGRTYSVTGGNLGELAAFGRISGRNVAALEPWA